MKKSLTKSMKVTSVALLMLASTSMYAGGKSSKDSKFSKFLSKIAKFFGKKSSGKKGGKDKGGMTSIPVDGELGLLLLGAAAFGVKKLRNNGRD